jgi:hypothetical protein
MFLAGMHCECAKSGCCCGCHHIVTRVEECLWRPQGAANVLVLKHVALGEFAQKQYGHRRVHKKDFASTDWHASNTVVAAVAHVAAADPHPVKLEVLLPP